MFLSQSHIYQALIATLFTWSITALGGATVFFCKKINQNIMSLMFGFGAGVMIAASIFSLILPSIELSNELNQTPWVMAMVGFLIGGLFILLIDLLLPHLHINHNEAEGVKSSFSRKVLLVFAITLHNIPEGLAIGVAFGASFLGITSSTIQAAWILAIGIGLQNFPEGMAVSLPLRNEGMSRRKSFFYGQASGIVEPIAGVIGALLVKSVRSFLPLILAFAAGAMIYVVAEEMIPSGKTSKENKLGTIGVMIGFAIMMALDLALS